MHRTYGTIADRSNFCDKREFFEKLQGNSSAINVNREQMKFANENGNEYMNAPIKPQRTYLHGIELLSAINENCVEVADQPTSCEEGAQSSPSNALHYYASSSLLTRSPIFTDWRDDKKSLSLKKTERGSASIRCQPMTVSIQKLYSSVRDWKRNSQIIADHNFQTSSEIYPIPAPCSSNQNPYAISTIDYQKRSINRVNCLSSDSSRVYCWQTKSLHSNSTICKRHPKSTMAQPRLCRATPVIRKPDKILTEKPQRSGISIRSDLSASEGCRYANDIKQVSVEKINNAGAENKLKRKVTRAKLVHRRTLALYDKQVNAFCTQMAPKLFNRALIIRLVPRNHRTGIQYANIRSDYVPEVSYRFPENCPNGETSTTVDCPDLFIPDFTRARTFASGEQWKKNEEFMLTLTDERGKRTFAYCIRHLLRKDEHNEERESVSDETFLPEVFAIVSPIHAPSFYTALARECIKYLQKGLDILKNLLNAVYCRHFPSSGGELWVAETKGNQLKREIRIRGQGPLLGRTDCSFIVHRLGAEITVSIIGALFAEQRIIIGGESVQSVCHAVQSLISLIQPFSWPYTLVPVLPDSLLEIVNSPTPYLLGVLRSNFYKLKGLIVGGSSVDVDDFMKEDQVIVDLDGGIFVPQFNHSHNATENCEYKVRNAMALCEKLLIPKKLALSLVSSFKEALSGGPGCIADDLLQKAVLVWLASLIGHYKSCGFHASYLTDLNGNDDLYRTSVQQMINSHTSKSARRFTEWFVETGIFRDWIRRKVISPTDKVLLDSEDAANQRLDQFAVSFGPHSTPKRFSSIFSLAQSALFRTHLMKKS